MTADPRVISTAYTINEIKNTFNPDGAGTVIKQDVSNPQVKPLKVFRLSTIQV